jgi:hypothetical protein
MKSKKSQLKIQQMSFMIMAVFLFFILAGLFYLAIQSKGLRNEATLAGKNQAIELAKVLAGSAEFSCGDYCIDADRLMVLAKKTQYIGFWKVNSIKVRKVFNETKEVRCTEANYPNCNTVTVYDSGKQGSSVYSYVAWCWREKLGGYPEKRCEMAKFIVGYEVK